MVPLVVLRQGQSVHRPLFGLLFYLGPVIVVRVAGGVVTVELGRATVELRFLSGCGVGRFAKAVVVVLLGVAADQRRVAGWLAFTANSAAGQDGPNYTAKIYITWLGNTITRCY